MNPRFDRLRRVVDALSLVLVVFGETLSFFLTPGKNIGGFGPLFVVGVLTLLVRHMIWPRRPLPVLLWRWLVAPAGPHTSFTLTITISTRVAVLLAGWLSVATVGYQLQPGQPRLARHELLNLPTRFDAGWYMGIARRGYDWREDLRERQQSVNFFPAYPIAMRAGGDLVTVPAKLFSAPGFLENGNTRVIWGGMLVSLLCLLAAACRIVALARAEISEDQRVRWALVLVLLWPFALFLSGVYTEPMMLLAMAGMILAWREERFRDAIIWGLLCGLTRPNGWVVSIALLADLTLAKRTQHVSFGRIAAVAAPLVGTALFSLYLFTLTGNPLEWVQSQKAWGLVFDPTAFVTQRFEEIERIGVVGYVRMNAPDVVTLVCVGISLSIAVWWLRRREWLYAALIASYLLPALVTNTPSIGRMTAVLFPISFALVQIVPARGWPLLAIVFGAIQMWFAARHFIWLPPY